MTRVYITTIAIELRKPPTCPIYVGIFVDRKRVHRLPPIAEDLPFLWSIDLPIDVGPQSQITLQVKEVHRVRVWQGDLGSSIVSDHPDWLRYDPSGAHKDIVQQEEKFTLSVKFSPALEIKDSQLIAERAIKVTDVRNSILGKLGQARSAVETIVSVLEHIEEVHPIAKAALGILTAAFKFLEEEEKYDESMRDLALGMADMLSFAEAVNQHAKILQLKDTISQMMLMVEDASRFILESQSSSAIGRAATALVSSERRNKIDEYIKHFETLRSGFDRGVTIQILDVSSQSLQVSSQALQVSNQVLGILEAAGKKSLGDHDRLLLDKLPVARSAGYDPSRSCMDGTRTKVLEDIIEWVCRPTGSTKFLWIHGSAGAGKSSIASSTARELERRKMLGATFFCSRDKPELRDPALLLPTIAARLAVVFPALGMAIADQLRENPQLGGSAMQFQYEGLFVSPFKQISTSDIPTRVTPLVIVIDAFDECGTVETRKTLLNYLLEVSRLTDWLKVVATSRPQPDINRVLKSSSICTAFPLHLNDDTTINDVLLFTQARMAEIAQNDELPSDWPGAVRTKQLAEQAGGLFIWAQTAALFITNGQDPEKRLHLLLSTRSPPGAYARLDMLYTTALMGAFGGADDSDNLETFRQVVGTIVTTLTPLPIESLHDLLQERVSLVAIRKVVRTLGSVLYEDEQNDLAIRACHHSFVDFVTDASRCPQFFVDLRQHHTSLATVCLQIMQDRLRFNICDIESSYLFNDQIPDFHKRVKKAIPIPLRYSCIHWMAHLHNSPKDVALIVLEQFLARKTVLFWIEALSLLGEIPAAIHGLPLALGWFEARILHPALFWDLRLLQDPDDINSRFIADVHRFILGFKEPIGRSTPHLYISALPFAPTQSLISTRFLPSFPNTISVDDRESLWSPCLQTLEGHSDQICGVSWSPDGQRLVSGSLDNCICVWDSATGEMMQRLRGHAAPISSVSFSPNSQLIASGSWDRTIQIWDVGTGVPISPPLLGHDQPVMCVIFSPDGKHLASCSADETIRVWDVTTREVILDPFRGHSGLVRAIAYSPDGTRLVSCSDDKTVRVWDVGTGRAILGPLAGHISEVYTVDFSPDGCRILSGSADRSIIIWDSATGAMSFDPLRVGGSVSCVKFSPDGHLVLSTSFESESKIRIWDAESGSELLNQGHSNSINSACFSPNGQQFVTGSSDQTVQIWEFNSFHPSTSLVSDSWHTDLITSIALSSDGKYIASASLDNTVRVWHADTGASACAPLLHGHAEPVNAVTFSPDSQHILTGSSDNTLRLWTVITWERAMEPFSGHTGGVTCAAFSPGGHFIVSGSEDHTIRLWNPATGKEICEALQGHQDGVKALDISSDGYLIASGSKDQTVKLWDSATRQNLFSLSIGKGQVESIKFSSDGQYIASYSHDSSFRLWDIQKQVVSWETSLSASVGPGCCIFSRNSRHLFCSTGSLIFILDATTGSTIRAPFKGHNSYIRSMAVSTGGGSLISGSHDNTVRAWDIQFKEEEYHHELRSDARNLFGPVGQDGWVQLKSGEPLLWIPSEYRDGLWKRALYSIPPTAQNHPRTIDCSRFRHGNTWTDIQAM